MAKGEEEWIVFVFAIPRTIAGQQGMLKKNEKAPGLFISTYRQTGRGSVATDGSGMTKIIRFS